MFHLRLWGLAGFFLVWFVWEGAGDGRRPGLGRRGREADLLIPLVFVKAVRGGENLPVWGFPVHQKGSMALGAPCCGAHPIRRQVQCRPRSAPCKRALHLSAVMAHLRTAEYHSNYGVGRPFSNSSPDTTRDGLHRLRRPSLRRAPDRNITRPPWIQQKFVDQQSAEPLPRLFHCLLVQPQPKDVPMCSSLPRHKD